MDPRGAKLGVELGRIVNVDVAGMIARCSLYPCSEHVTSIQHKPRGKSSRRYVHNSGWCSMISAHLLHNEHIATNHDPQAKSVPFRSAYYSAPRPTAR